MGGKDVAAFKADRRTVDAVVYNLQIIGEAARHLPDRIANEARGVPWAESRAMRNILAHEYFAVDRAIIWKTTRQSLPALRVILVQMIEANDES